jgi:hypothetical protein
LQLVDECHRPLDFRLPLQYQSALGRLLPSPVGIVLRLTPKAIHGRCAGRLGTSLHSLAAMAKIGLS